MKKRKTEHFLKIGKLVLIFSVLISSCEKEPDILNENLVEQNNIKIKQLTLNQLKTEEDFKKSFEIFESSNLNKNSQSKSKVEEVYEFNINSELVNKIEIGDVTSYTFMIDRDYETPNFYENLVIVNDSLNNNHVYIIKYTPDKDIELITAHNSFEFKGERTVKKIAYNNTILNYASKSAGGNCYVVYDVWCSYSYDHIATGSCFQGNHLYLKARTECSEGGGIPTGGIDGPVGGNTPIDGGNGVLTTNMYLTPGFINFYEDLTLQQQQYTNYHFQKISTFLDQNLYSIEAKNFAIEAIEFLRINAQYNFEQYENWFSTNYIELETNTTVVDPNDITFETPLTQQALPAFSTFLANFPKKGTSGNYTPLKTTDAYILVGGSLLNSHINQNSQYNNACAIRASRGLLYSGIQIPVLKYNGSQRTQKGADGKNYILDAVSFNTYMVAKFGETSAKLEGADANDPVKVAALLNGKNGIYVIVNSNTTTAGYSGHCDVIINGMCISGAYTGDVPGGIKSIRIWELN